MQTGLRDLLRYTHATGLVGDLLKMRARDVGLGDMALVEMPDGAQSLAVSDIRGRLDATHVGRAHVYLRTQYLRTLSDHAWATSS